MQWSLNVGGNDDVLYRLPRSSQALVLENHWIKVSYYGSNTSIGSQRPIGNVEVAIFQPAASSQQIELTIHDPRRKKSSSYQLDIAHNIVKMQVLPLPPTNTKRALTKHMNQTQQRQQVFGTLLVVATVKGIFVFSLLFTRQHCNSNFVLSEFLDLSEPETMDRVSLLEDRQIREINSQVVLLSDNDNCASLVVVASSLPFHFNRIPPSNRNQGSSSIQTNVDALIFSLQNHIHPIFHYCKQDTVLGKSRSLNLLKGVNRVKTVGFLGTSSKITKLSHTMAVTVLFAGELKLIPVPLNLIFCQSPTASVVHTIQVQTILLAGICAHPSISGLGETVMMQQKTTTANTNTTTNTCDLAILFRPKLKEIGAQSGKSIANILVPNHKSVSFSPAEHSIENSSDIDRKAGRFFPHNKKTPQKNTSIQCISDWKTPTAQQFESTRAESKMQVMVSPEENAIHNKSSNTNSEILCSSGNDISSLVGINFIDFKSTFLPVDTDSTFVISNSSDKTIDLTGKSWSPSTLNLNLSPLSSVKSTDACDENVFGASDSALEKVDQALTTPTNLPIRANPRSALKSIRCTTPLQGDEVDQFAYDSDHLSHVVIVHVEQDGLDSGIQLKIGFSSIALPPALANFDSASLRWVDDKRGKSLIVAAVDAESCKIAKLLQIGDEQDSLEIETVSSPDLTSIISSLEHAKKMFCFKIKGMSLEPVEDGNGQLEARLLLNRQLKISDRTSSMASPINISLTESVRLCLASTILSFESAESEDVDNANATLVAGSNAAAVVEKLDHIIGLLGTFDARMDNLEKQILCGVEESMRII